MKSGVRTLLPAFITLVLANPAAGQASVGRDALKIQAGTYAIYSVHTHVLFAVDDLGVNTSYGAFTGTTGTLVLDPRHVAGSSFDVMVPTETISTTNAKLDSELKSAQWFDVARYPDMTFKSTKVIQTGKNTAEVTGDLTLHGITKPLTLSATLHGNGVNPIDHSESIGFDLSGKLKRSDFGITKYIGLVGDDIDLTISAAFEKKS